MIVPFRSIIRFSGASCSNDALLMLPTQRVHVSKAQHIRKVIAHARAKLPIEINCFPQAVTAVILMRLRNVPYSLFFGVRRERGEFKAHAWVACGRVTVCGENGSPEYAIISTYTYQPDGGVLAPPV